RLEADILNHEPSLDWQPPAPAAPPRDSFSVDLTGASPVKSTQNREGLVGRDDQLDRLTTLLGEAAGGRPRIVLVTGEPGIGKTRLLEALLAGATEQGVRSAWGRSLDDRGAPAFWPWSQAIRDLLDQVPADELRAAFGGRA